MLAACANPVAGAAIRFRRIGRLADQAMIATAPPGDGRLFVVEKVGAIRIFDETEQLLVEPFLDLSEAVGGPVVRSQEQGLLGLAFHPEYAANGQFFVLYTRRAVPADPLHQFTDVLARCMRNASDPNKADAASCVDVLAIPDFAANHNGGMIEFGSDGLLYIGTGDGGAANDPRNNGQALVDNPATLSIALLGKMLRIDVDKREGGKQYGIPAGNPFAQGGGAPEIFMIGLRNPWRWSFDRATGDLWIADVGQNTIEELDVVAAADQAGKNFGWDIWEGNRCVAPPCATAGFVFPLHERTHAAPPAGDGWEAIIGGQVYRGTCYPDLVGTYIFGDAGTRNYATAKLQSDGTLAVNDVVPASGQPLNPPAPASIHADARGELWLTSTTGDVYAVEGGPP